MSQQPRALAPAPAPFTPEHIDEDQRQMQAPAQLHQAPATVQHQEPQATSPLTPEQRAAQHRQWPVAAQHQQTQAGAQRHQPQASNQHSGHLAASSSSEIQTVVFNAKFLKETFLTNTEFLLANYNIGNYDLDVTLMFNGQGYRAMVISGTCIKLTGARRQTVYLALMALLDSSAQDFQRAYDD